MISIKLKKLKRVVIKEELFKLTGSMEEAVILNQFIYWSKRTKDADQYIAEEKKRVGENDKSINSTLSKGWIYKTAEELADEVMLGISITTLRKHLKKLVDQGYLSRRNNPKYKWDKTFQYRVNSTKLMFDLQKMGYELEDYPELSRNYKIDVSNKKNNDLNGQNCDSKRENCAAIPEITSKITSENIPKTSSSKEVDEDGEKNNHLNQFDLICETYLRLSKKTRSRLSDYDQKTMWKVVRKNWDTYQVIDWIKECFKQFKPQHERDAIQSFQYVANYIFDQAYKNTQEVLQDEESTGYFAGDEYFQRYESKII
ncbi:winged helix-turn-helix domain-containing protein [Sporosarcina pasteurii]|uniref:winged helix-turn-helix domain-containing protein n=1 Tax=Sporosarcina pasteurii TaxID=1474 RepID=UPI000E1B999D|nr:winged helix-turn-helix domain-containing protein [Sporosarcina pasteurii]MDS9470897.1 winged helix-turn-helix domain-containing protein [Sporosarcina pasteurii]QBQ05443.1 ArsR family transcriptional regulator [Sporosarcina pasteurii]